MERMPLVIRILIAAVLAVLALTLFCFLYDFPCGGYLNAGGTGTDYSCKPNLLYSNMTEGIAFNRMDSNGYNNASVYTDDVDILLMGSSHMLALQVGADENTGALLRQFFPDKKIYNIGMNDHMLYAQMRNLGFAVERYHPKTVIMEFSSPRLNTDFMSYAVRRYNMPEQDAVKTGTLVRIADCVPVLRPVFYRIRNIAGSLDFVPDWMKEKEEGSGGSGGAADSSISDFYRETLSEFLSLTEAVREQGVENILLVFHPEERLEQDGSISYVTDALYLDLFADLCAEKGLVFVDMTDGFRELYSEEHMPVHGFCNTLLPTGHLNKYGHRVLAEKLAAAIRGLEDEDVV